MVRRPTSTPLLDQLQPPAPDGDQGREGPAPPPAAAGPDSPPASSSPTASRRGPNLAQLRDSAHVRSSLSRDACRAGPAPRSPSRSLQLRPPTDPTPAPTPAPTPTVRFGGFGVSFGPGPGSEHAQAARPGALRGSVSFQLDEGEGAGARPLSRPFKSKTVALGEGFFSELRRQARSSGLARPSNAHEEEEEEEGDSGAGVGLQLSRSRSAPPPQSPLATDSRSAAAPRPAPAPLPSSAALPDPPRTPGLPRSLSTLGDFPPARVVRGLSRSQSFQRWGTPPRAPPTPAPRAPAGSAEPPLPPPAGSSALLSALPRSPAGSSALGLAPPLLVPLNASFAAVPPPAPVAPLRSSSSSALSSALAIAAAAPPPIPGVPPHLMQQPMYIASPLRLSPAPAPPLAPLPFPIPPPPPLPPLAAGAREAAVAATLRLAIAIAAGAPLPAAGATAFMISPTARGLASPSTGRATGQSPAAPILREDLSSRAPLGGGSGDSPLSTLGLSVDARSGRANVSHASGCSTPPILACEPDSPHETSTSTGHPRAETGPPLRSRPRPPGSFGPPIASPAPARADPLSSSFPAISR
eukprot:tig00000391_g24844.t1